MTKNLASFEEKIIKQIVAQIKGATNSTSSYGSCWQTRVSQSGTVFEICDQTRMEKLQVTIQGPGMVFETL